jgi:DNA-3-methyladenine glycosylase I
MKSCEWAGNDPLYLDYHHKEWGVPLFDDEKIFEFLILETFQAGLSWITILRKRDNFRIAFDNFDYRKIANYTEEKINALLADASIVRNRLKILATVANAQAFLRIQEEFGTFSEYIWSFAGGQPIQNNFTSLNQIPARTELSDKISKELKKRGFKFVGSTVIYAHMQATGMVNDHCTYCFRHKELSNF